MAAACRLARRCSVLLVCQLVFVAGLRTQPRELRSRRSAFDFEKLDSEDALNFFGVRRTSAQAIAAEEANPEAPNATLGPGFFGRERWGQLVNRTGPLREYGSASACPSRALLMVVGFVIYLGVWCLAAVLFALWRRRKEGPEEPAAASERNAQWDRVRFHLMTTIIWTHWLGKWGLNNSRAGWAFLCWAFTFHIVGFVFLSGVFTRGYAKHFAARGVAGAKRVALRCLDIFIVYIIFSWLRGLVDLSLENPKPHSGTIIKTLLQGTFLFHQAPWYLAALIIWRLSALLLWWVPAIIVASLVVAAICPYHALASMRDPFAFREVMHYLPYFVAGLMCGRKRLEKAFSVMGTFTPWICGTVLLAFAIVIWFPLGWLYDDPLIRWMLITKAVPPRDAGGVVTMLALYVAKMVSTLAALGLFSSAFGIDVVDKLCEVVGKRSMTVYMVHMVFIMVPGDAFCLDKYFANRADRHGVLMVLVMFVLAVAANLLCGSAFTAWLFRPLVEPLGTLGCLGEERKDKALALARGSLITR